MLINAIKQIKTALLLLILMTILTGLIYPGVVTLFAQLICSWRANGSLLEVNGKIIGSKLIGQSFTDDKYFWSRPSATTPYPYNAANSSGSNFGPSNPGFITAIKDRVTVLRKASPGNNDLVPVDLVTASGSGLDPEISPLAAYYQVTRIAKARKIPENSVKMLIHKAINQRTFGVLGEPRVNVLLLNLALDNLTVHKG